ncbi:uncharacterized protein LOC124433814 [Xenia sp. Carnegie-2017]|uniref:uncharacterized protein LOC124433814 n=1 Tax=Xenia sp. Carnegie-2017 TaxID=2897299 RepID=UPI001F04E213|nr:uncharacterized protein LOC124433814 [Xenia sp. Carnegie-2017]
MYVHCKFDHIDTTMVDVTVQFGEDSRVDDEEECLLVRRAWDTERVMKMQVLLDEQNILIGQLESDLRKQRGELNSSMKCRLELEAILKDIEMQEKAQLTAQVDDLTKIKDELIEEITNLSVELEKQRTNVESLSTELAGLKAQLMTMRRKGLNQQDRF